MAYVVAIRNNITGEIRIQPEDLEWQTHSLFWWTEGNFGCDCNREDEWLRAGGATEEDIPDGNECGHERFSVLYAEFPDGSRIMIDKPLNKSGVNNDIT